MRQHDVILPRPPTQPFPPHRWAQTPECGPLHHGANCPITRRQPPRRNDHPTPPPPPPFRISPLPHHSPPTITSVRPMPAAPLPPPAPPSDAPRVAHSLSTFPQARTHPPASPASSQSHHHPRLWPPRPRPPTPNTTSRVRADGGDGGLGGGGGGGGAVEFVVGCVVVVARLLAGLRRRATTKARTTEGIRA